MAHDTEQRSIEVVVREALEALTRGDVSKWPEMFASDGVQEFPFAPDGSPKRIEGRDRIAEYLSDYPEKLDLDRIGEIAWNHDGATAIAQFAVEGTAVETGRAYNQSYVSIIEHRDGRITRYIAVGTRRSSWTR